MFLKMLDTARTYAAGSSIRYTFTEDERREIASIRNWVKKHFPKWPHTSRRGHPPAADSPSATHVADHPSGSHGPS